MKELTPREFQILILLANGRTIRRAAQEMGIAPQTAKNLMSQAYSKLEVHNRYQAFLELGWLTPPEVE